MWFVFMTSTSVQIQSTYFKLPGVLLFETCSLWYWWILFLVYWNENHHRCFWFKCPIIQSPVKPGWFGTVLNPSNKTVMFGTPKMDTLQGTNISCLGKFRKSSTQKCPAKKPGMCDHSLEDKWQRQTLGVLESSFPWCFWEATSKFPRG